MNVAAYSASCSWCHMFTASCRSNSAIFSSHDCTALGYKQELQAFNFSANGGPEMSMWPNKTFFCLVQDSPYYSSLKNNCRRLLVNGIWCVLYVLASLVRRCWVKSGPNTDESSSCELLEKLLFGQNKLAEDVAVLCTQQTDMKNRLADWDTRFSETEKQTARMDSFERTVKSSEAKKTQVEHSNLVVFDVS